MFVWNEKGQSCYIMIIIIIIIEFFSYSSL